MNEAPLPLRYRLLHGLVLPHVVLVALMLLIANVDSRAGAAEFAGLAVFFMLLFALPVTVIIGAVLVSGASSSALALFGRGMIAPAVVIGAAIAYQAGLWNWVT